MAVLALRCHDEAPILPRGDCVMRKIGLLAVATLLAVAPLSVQAQTAAPAPAAPAPAATPVPAAPTTPAAPTAAAPAPAAPAPVAAASPTVFGLPPGQALAIGVGMAAGGVGVGALAHGPFSTLIGAAAGALIGDWWYASKPAGGGPRR